MAQTKKTKAGEKDFSASSTPSRKYLIAAYIGGLALAGYAARLAWVYMTYHVLPLQGIILFVFTDQMKGFLNGFFFIGLHEEQKFPNRFRIVFLPDLRGVNPGLFHLPGLSRILRTISRLRSSSYAKLMGISVNNSDAPRTQSRLRIGGWKNGICYAQAAF